MSGEPVTAPPGPQASRRRRVLAAALAGAGSMSVAEAASLTGASTATAARDLSALATEVGGLRVRGGMVMGIAGLHHGVGAAADGPVDGSGLDRLAITRSALEHVERAEERLAAGDPVGADVHARLSQALSVLAAAAPDPA